MLRIKNYFTKIYEVNTLKSIALLCISNEHVKKQKNQKKEPS